MYCRYFKTSRDKFFLIFFPVFRQEYSQSYENFRKSFSIYILVKTKFSQEFKILTLSISASTNNITRSFFFLPHIFFFTIKFSLFLIFCWLIWKTLRDLLFFLCFDANEWNLNLISNYYLNGVLFDKLTTFICKVKSNSIIGLF